MFAEKYKPKKLEEITGNNAQIRQVKEWIKIWEKGKSLFLFGRSGCGKTTVAELIAKENNFEIIRSNANEKRSYKELMKNIFESTKQISLVQKSKIIVIDDLEMIDSTKGIIEIIKNSIYPVILIGTDPYESKMSSLRKYCTLVKFSAIRSDQIEKFLKKVLAEEKIDYDERAVRQLSKTCSGDVRSALNDIETLSSSKITQEAVKTLPTRLQERDIFNTLKIIFKTKDIKNSSNAIKDSDKNPEDIVAWLEENIPLEYEDPKEVYNAYDYISKADVFFSRNQTKYFIDMGIHGVAMSKKEVYKKFTKYKFPKFIRKRPLGSLSEKISKKFHISRKKSFEYICLLSLVVNEELAKKLCLDEKDIEVLNQTKNVFSPKKR